MTGIGFGRDQGQQQQGRKDRENRQQAVGAMKRRGVFHNLTAFSICGRTGPRA